MLIRITFTYSYLNKCVGFLQKYQMILFQVLLRNTFEPHLETGFLHLRNQKLCAVQYYTLSEDSKKAFNFMYAYIKCGPAKLATDFKPL